MFKLSNNVSFFVKNDIGSGDILLHDTNVTVDNQVK